MEDLDLENEIKELEIDTKTVDEVEAELSNLSLAVEYYNDKIVNKPANITMEYLYDLEKEYNHIVNLNYEYRQLAYTAFDINMEANISTESKFLRFASNVIEFIKKLIKWVITKINQMLKGFRNTRRKLINIVATLLKSNDNLLKELTEIRNTNLELFKTEVKYDKLKESVEEYINKSPAFYIGINTFEELFNYNGDVDSINSVTKTIILTLGDTLLEARALLKRNSTEFDYDKLYNELMKVKLVKVRDSRFMLNAKAVLDDAKAIDRKAKDLFITNLTKNKVTIGLLFKPNTDTDELLLVNDIFINSKQIREFKDPISLDYIFRKIVAGFHNIDKDLVMNRDAVTDLIDNYNKTIDLAESLANSPAIANPEQLKEMVMYLNKNIFPMIFKGYMNQYLGLVLSFNNRINLIKLIIEKVKEETSIVK